MKPYYETELGKLYHGDCLEIMPQLEPVDLVLTDPPYKKVTCGKGRKSLGGMLCRNKHLVNSGKLFKHNDIEFKEWLPLLNNKLKNKTHAYVFSDYLNTENLLMEARRAGLKLCNCRPMIKNNCVVNKYGMLDYELIWMFRVGEYKEINNCGVLSTIRTVSPKNRLHPTQKSIGVMQVLIKDSSNNLEVILDPFIGSGTTAIACERLNRKWIGIEIEERYCQIAAKRIENERKQLKLF